MLPGIKTVASSAFPGMSSVSLQSICALYAETFIADKTGSARCGVQMEKADCVIRELNWNDMDDIVENYYSYYDELEHSPDLGLTLFNSKPTYEDEIKWFSALYSDIIKRDGFASVAERNGKVVGLCEIRAMTVRECVSHIGTLGIAIHRDSRGIGIGERLLKRTIDSSRDRFEMIILDVFTTNVTARRLYSRLGFRSMGVLPNAVKRNQRYYDEERMYLSLK